MPINSARELLEQELNDIEDAERQAADALDELARQADDDELSAMLERRKDAGARILEEVGRALKTLKGGARPAAASAARGLIEKTRALADEAGTPEMKRAVIIAGAQKLQHYCIAAWGTVKALARELDAEDLAQAMENAVEEGYRWDAEMSDLAESRVNPEALEADADARS